MQVHLESPDDFRRPTKLSKEENHQFDTFKLTDEKLLRVVLRANKETRKDLEDLGL